MSEVAGIKELEDLSDYAWMGASDADRDKAEVWQSRLEALLLNRQELIEKLDRIANPITWIQIDARNDGTEIDGRMAVALASDANYLRDIADRALAKAKELDNE